MCLRGKETIFPMMSCTRTGIQISQFTWCIIKTMRIISKNSLRFILSTPTPYFSTTSCKPIFLYRSRSIFHWISCVFPPLYNMGAQSTFSLTFSPLSPMLSNGGIFNTGSMVEKSKRKSLLTLFKTEMLIGQIVL